jgi:hypothetical protein
MTQSVLKIFNQALTVTGKGMLALFIFMFLFFVLLLVIDKIFPGRDTGDENPTP